MQTEHFHSPLLGCVLRSRRKQNKRYAYFNHWIRQARCKTHKITVCYCGFEYGWHYNKQAGVIEPIELSKPVLQFSLDGALVAEHPSIGSASRKAGLTHYSIKLCMEGRIEMAGGYIWKPKP